jgi:thiamine pyrophosphate-dependent acetolactate synthase large subunit-like protein
MGAMGIRVKTAKEIGPAFKKALDSNRPVVIDVVTDINISAPLAWELNS